MGDITKVAAMSPLCLSSVPPRQLWVDDREQNALAAVIDDAHDTEPVTEEEWAVKVQFAALAAVSPDLYAVCDCLLRGDVTKARQLARTATARIASLVDAHGYVAEEDD